MPLNGGEDRPPHTPCPNEQQTQIFRRRMQKQGATHKTVTQDKIVARLKKRTISISLPLFLPLNRTKLKKK